MKSAKDAGEARVLDGFERNYRAGQQFRPPPGWEGQFGEAGGASGGAQFTDLNGFSDFFASLFGAAAGGGPGGGLGGGRRRHESEAEAEAGQLEISLEDAYRGTKRRVILNEQGHARTIDVRSQALRTARRCASRARRAVLASSCGSSTCHTPFTASRARMWRSSCRSRRGKAALSRSRCRPLAAGEPAHTGRRSIWQAQARGGRGLPGKPSGTTDPRSGSSPYFLVTPAKRRMSGCARSLFRCALAVGPGRPVHPGCPHSSRPWLAGLPANPS